MTVEEEEIQQRGQPEQGKPRRGANWNRKKQEIGKQVKHIKLLK